MLTICYGTDTIFHVIACILITVIETKDHSILPVRKTKAQGSYVALPAANRDERLALPIFARSNGFPATPAASSRKAFPTAPGLGLLGVEFLFDGSKI